MIEIREVKTRRSIKKFINFQLKLYKGNKFYVPPLIADEIKYLQKAKNPAFENADIVLFTAYKDGEMVGRIAGFILHDYNTKMQENRVRFSRFDSINDKEVAKALFCAVEGWAKAKGMDIAHGPLGANDLDREGLLIDGFEELSTFETQYSYAYYVDLIEANGYKKEVDWIEYRIYLPSKVDERVARISNLVLKRSKLHLAPNERKGKYIDKYQAGIFETLDAAYAKLYGVVPINDGVRREVVKQFKLLIQPRFISIVLDEFNKVVAFGLVMPALAKAVQKSRGKYLPFGVFRYLRASRKPKDVDLALIAVRPEYQLKGVNAIVLGDLTQSIINEGIAYVETNLLLESNSQVQAQFEKYKKDQHKKRRSYVKKIK
jgi:GNAT superfamily N-acetyltransferase